MIDHGKDKTVADKNKPSMPSGPELRVLTIHALRELGGSGHISEIYEKVVELGSLTQEQLEQTYSGKHNYPRIEHDLGWVRTELKWIGTVENSARAVWSLTELGYEISDNDILKDWKTYEKKMLQRAAERKKSTTKGGSDVDAGESNSKEDKNSTDGDEKEDEDSTDLGWKELVLERLAVMDPKSFEQFARQLLHKAGFQNMEVLGKSNDGGIDGRSVYQVSSVSLPVYFQCMRRKSSVGAQVIHDFRGAMSEHCDEGLLITTSSFTPEAIKEARRDGAPPVDLMDGDSLCDLLKKHNMGVTTRQVEEVTPDLKYFDRFEKTPI